MFRVHVISDLTLKFNEFTPKNELNIPDVELVILNGNIAKNPKRGMLYAEELCFRYPDVQFVYNYGLYERFPIGIIPKSKYEDEVLNSLKIRSELNSSWPKNLHCFPGSRKIITLRNGHVADIYCALGFPKIIKSNIDWHDSYFYKNCIIDISMDITDTRLELPNNTSKVNHGDLPIWATQEWINNQNAKEFKEIRAWELDYHTNSGYKILVMHMNPINDSRCAGLDVDFFNIHLNNGLWVGSNTTVNNCMYLGAKYISNPGRGEEQRSLIFETQTV